MNQPRVKYDLIVTPVIRVAHKLCNDYKDVEYPATALLCSIVSVYFHDPQLVNTPESPPAPRLLRRVDLTTLKIDATGWNFEPVIFWEVKKANASPDEIMKCDEQLNDAAFSRFPPGTIGKCWLVSVIGCFYKIWTWERENPNDPPKTLCKTPVPLTDGGMANYCDISSDYEAPLVDALFRDMREEIGFVLSTHFCKPG